jgi:YspA, cpYpsA-related SLOG family
VRLLICGSRNWSDDVAIDELLLAALYRVAVEGDGPLVVLQGGARGADRLARERCEYHTVRCEQYDADWQRDGRRAGVLRNLDMLNQGRPDRVVAFTDDFANPHSGTRHMCQIALRAGLPVRLVRHAEGTRGETISRTLGIEDLAA